jgi:Na+-transporting methylmalonyl-CoA/oxaloacetate decarboxylase gamma subunit
MIRKTIILALATLASALMLRAQNVSDLIISEALAEPDSTGILDGYGRRGGWIELYNTSTGTVNFGGCFLTDDISNLKKSIIPKSDNRTKLGPRQVVLFYASGNSADGTFYVDFTLQPGSSIYLVSNDGHTIIDSLKVPETLPCGKSVMKLADDLRQKHFVPVETPADPSPAILNGSQTGGSKAQRMAETDPHGFTLSIVSVSVVFTALAILWFLFWLFFERPAKRKAAPAKPKKQPKNKTAAQPDEEVAAAIAAALDMESCGDEYAAIAAALHLHFSTSVHDIEPGIVTIQCTGASAWKNKQLNFRKLPR